MVATLALAALAGALSILSPCVLPLLPIVLGTAAGKGKSGPVLLALGLVASFVGIGLFVSLIGFSVGLDAGFFRKISAVLLLVVGLVLAVPALQRRFAVAAGPVGNLLNAKLDGGDSGQFAVGLLLGAVWSPLRGANLGAASVLAAQGKDLTQVALTMIFFGFGVALPLVALGLASRQVMMRWRGRLLSAGAGLKLAMGVLLAVSGLLILSGQDKHLEAVLVDVSPEWLTALTTRF